MMNFPETVGRRFKRPIFQGSICAFFSSVYMGYIFWRNFPSKTGLVSDHMAVSENNGTPKSSHFNRVFHYFHHPFWGEHPYFWKHPHFPMQAAAQRLLDEPALAQRVASTSAAGEFIAQVAPGRLRGPKGLGVFSLKNAWRIVPGIVST